MSSKSSSSPTHEDGAERRERTNEDDQRAVELDEKTQRYAIIGKGALVPNCFRHQSRDNNCPFGSIFLRMINCILSLQGLIIVPSGAARTVIPTQVLGVLLRNTNLPFLSQKSDKRTGLGWADRVRSRERMVRLSGVWW